MQYIFLPLYICITNTAKDFRFSLSFLATKIDSVFSGE